jgi:hypothetical protein
MKINKIIKATMIASALTVGLSSCTTFGNYAAHKNLVIESKMSDSVFLTPVKKDQKVVYVSVKNTTEQTLTDLNKEVADNLQSSGWKVTDDPDAAFYMLQVNVLQAGEAKDNKEAMSTISDGFGSIVGGSAIGTGVGLMTGDYRTGGEVGLAVAGADFIGSQVVKDKTFSVVTDIQLGQKVDGNVTQVTQADLSNGSSSTSQTSTDNSNWKYTRLRVGTVADQINLTLDEAMPKIQTGLAKEISGILK